MKFEMEQGSLSAVVPQGGTQEGGLCFFAVTDTHTDTMFKCSMRAIQRPGGGGILAPSEWSLLPGQAVVTGAHAGRIERGRRVV
jgi:hypothetical protein